MKIKKRLIALAMSIMMVFGTTSLCYAAEADNVPEVQSSSSEEARVLLDSAIMVDTVDLDDGSVGENLVYLNVSGYSRYEFEITFRGLEGASVVLEAVSPTGVRTNILTGTVLPAGDWNFSHTATGSGRWTFELEAQQGFSGKAAVALIQAYGIS